MPLSKSGVVFILGSSEDEYDDYMDNPNYSLTYYKILQEKNLTLFDKFINLFEYLTYF
jgi:hypothetical protein